MAIVEGTHTQGEGGHTVRYRVDYEAVGATINYRAELSSSAGGATTRREGQFDFDAAKIDAAAAVDAFMQNHIGKADWAAAP
jgi:hypothetical protein